MKFSLCEKCKYNFDGECEFYSMGSGNDIDKPCRGDEEDAFSDSVMDNLRVGEESVDEIKLKPCPFCGTPNTNLYFVKVDAPHGFDTVGIFCNSCKQTVILEENEWEGEDSKTRQKAIEAWNRRVNDE